ncbi:hypothetical protein J1605_008650 [Eschrichtius robustus]|uniref:L-methionine (R)-S-oxide reductase n=1 Tax=Eschrichtius robustus TaxID=9764 RepID=A0AB34GXD5_ESCRO|nr:hypothetical protein J1605_008650 [Eschrichtius robustus]
MFNGFLLSHASSFGWSCRDKKSCKVVFSQQELRKRLTPQQYHVTQEKGTESAFEGEYTHHKDPGIYKCVVCGTPLFKNLASGVLGKALCWEVSHWERSTAKLPEGGAGEAAGRHVQLTPVPWRLPLAPEKPREPVT